MTKAKLLQDLRDESTFSGALPYSLPDNELERIITNAEKYFYDNWKYSIESRYLLIPQEVFSTQQFKDARTITLPDCIAFVHDCMIANSGGSLFGTIDPDFGDQKFIGSELFLTPFIGEALMYRTIMLSFLDLTKAFSLDTIAFNFNKNTKRLTILGRTPPNDMIVQAMRKVDSEDLYEDEMFQRYTRAKTKVRLSQQLTAFGFQLPGGVTINYTQLKQSADDEWNQVKEDMDGEKTGSAFMFFARW